MEPTELLDVRLSFLATRGEDELPVREGMVTSGGAVVEEMGGEVEVKVFGEEREIETIPSGWAVFWFSFTETCWLDILKLWLRSRLLF